MKTYVLKVSLQKEEDGRWSASIPILPGCSSWGYSREEALTNVKDAAEIYIEDMIDAGEALPGPSDKIEVIDEPAGRFTRWLSCPSFVWRIRRAYPFPPCSFIALTLSAIQF
jgi:predicted RNase H-like HicB family nuclease